MIGLDDVLRTCGGIGSDFFEMGMYGFPRKGGGMGG